MSAVLAEGGKPLGQALELDEQLLAGARSIDADAARTGDATPGAPPPAAPVEVDWNHEAKDLIDFAGGMFFPLYPRLELVWNAERCATLTARLAPVLKKYNLNLEALLGKWGPEIMLVATIAPAVLPTVKAIKEDNAAARAAALEESRAAPPAGRAAAPPPPAAPGPSSAAASVTTTPPKDELKLHEKA